MRDLIRWVLIWLMYEFSRVESDTWKFKDRLQSLYGYVLAQYRRYIFLFWRHFFGIIFLWFYQKYITFMFHSTSCIICIILHPSLKNNFSASSYPESVSHLIYLSPKVTVWRHNENIWVDYWKNQLLCLLLCWTFEPSCTNDLARWLPPTPSTGWWCFRSAVTHISNSPTDSLSLILATFLLFALAFPLFLTLTSFIIL